MRIIQFLSICISQMWIKWEPAAFSAGRNPLLLQFPHHHKQGPSVWADTIKGSGGDCGLGQTRVLLAKELGNLCTRTIQPANQHIQPANPILNSNRRNFVLCIYYLEFYFYEFIIFRIGASFVLILMREFTSFYNCFRFFCVCDKKSK